MSARNRIRLSWVVIAALWGGMAAPSYGSQYSDAVLALNPDAYWRLDEPFDFGAGGVDEIGNNHPLTEFTTHVTQGEPGPRPSDGLLGFETTNLAYHINNNPAAGGNPGSRTATADYVPVTVADPRTIVAWLNMDVLPGNSGGVGGPPGTLGGEVAVLDYGTVPDAFPNTNTGFRFFVTRELDDVGEYTGRDLFTLNTLGISSNVQGDETELEIGQWYMLAVIFPDGATTTGDAELYVNGVRQTLKGDMDAPVDTGGVIQGTDGNPIPFRIGHDHGGFGTHGRVDEVTVWESGLTSADIEVLWNIAQNGASSIDGDFNDDGQWDCLDIDALVGAIANVSTDLSFDMNGDGQITRADITDASVGWLAVGGANNPAATGGNPFLVADANLDGTVDGQDFLAWNNNKFADTAEWCSGDFTADGTVDGQDFLEWNIRKFMSSSAPGAAVPEPGTAASGILALLAVYVAGVSLYCQKAEVT